MLLAIGGFAIVVVVVGFEITIGTSRMLPCFCADDDKFGLASS